MKRVLARKKTKEELAKARKDKKDALDLVLIKDQAYIVIKKLYNISLQDDIPYIHDYLFDNKELRKHLEKLYKVK